jgi:hypothetical protein
MPELVSTKSDGNPRKPAKKEWRPPELRKLPIAATASGTHISFNDGNTKKVGSSGNFS